MASQYIKLPVYGGAGGGSVNSVSADAPLFSTGGTDPVISLVLPLPFSDVGGATPNKIAGFNNSGDLEAIPGFSIDTTSNGLFIEITEQPNNVGSGFNANLLNVDFDPLQNSPNDDWTIQGINANFDVNNSGFSQGTSGEVATLLNLNATNTNTGPIGNVAQVKTYFNMGNGTDALTIKGSAYFYCFGDFNNNLTIDGNIQGIFFQPNVHTGVTLTNNYHLTAFADFSNISTASGQHNSFIANPNISSIKNNGSYSGLSINPTITTFTGNANFQGVGVFGQITTMAATGNFNGLVVSPNIATSHGYIGGLNVTPNITGGDANFQGVNIAPHGGATLGSVVGLNISLNQLATTDVTGVVGINSDSRIQINAATDLVASQGFQIGSRLEHLFEVPIGSPVTGTDALGVNIAGDFMAQDDVAAGPIGLGFNSVGFIASLAIAATKTVETVTVFLPASSLPDPGFATGGNITNFHTIRTFPPLAQGGTANITNYYGLKLDTSFGSFSSAATNAWGLFIDDDALGNYIAGNLAIGTASHKVSNSSVALEIGGTTKAVVFSNMTTTQKLLLTAVPGMQVFDTTLNQMSYFNGLSWVNF